MVDNGAVAVVSNNNLENILKPFLEMIDSLLKSKASLESDLTRSQSHNSTLMSELTRLHVLLARYDLESGFAETDKRIKLLEQEIEKLRTPVVDDQTVETINSLKVKLAEKDHGNEELMKENRLYAEKLGLQVETINSLKVKLVEKDRGNEELMKQNRLYAEKLGLRNVYFDE